MIFGEGNRIRASTQGEATNPTSTVLLAQITSIPAGEWQAYAYCGASTLATVLLEQCLSTGLGSTALRSSATNGEIGQAVLYVPVNQSAQYVLRFKAETGNTDLLRVRLSTTITGTAAAKLIIEPMV